MVFKQPDPRDACIWHVGYTGKFTNFYNPKLGDTPHVKLQRGHKIPEANKAYKLSNLRRLGIGNRAIAWDVDGLGVDRYGKKPHFTVHYGDDGEVETYNLPGGPTANVADLVTATHYCTYHQNTFHSSILFRRS